MEHIQRGFVKERLRQALQRNRKTSAALAEKLGIADNTLSRYLTGQGSPRPEVLRQIAAELGEPVGFFLRPMPPNIDKGSPSFMRSYSAATRRARLSAETLKERTRELTSYVEHYVNLPAANFPEFRFGDDPAALSIADIERAAEETRRFWGLGDGPIANVVRLVEHNGAIVVRVDLGDNTMNAFSQWGQPEERPYIVLSSGKHSAVLSRFDALHEVAHMVLHRHLPREFVARPEVHKLIEKQANRFAGAFLLPAKTYSRSVYMTTLAAFKELKPVWGASVAAQIMRVSQLGLITDRQAKRLWEVYAPWRYNEPFDAETPPEIPSTIRQSLDIIRDECGVSPSQVASDLPFNSADIAALGGLPFGYFREEPQRILAKRAAAPVLQFRREKSKPTLGDGVITLHPSRPKGGGAS